MCYLLSIGEENAEVESDVIQLKICEVLDNTTAVPECEKTDILCEDVSRSCKAKTTERQILNIFQRPTIQLVDLV